MAKAIMLSIRPKYVSMILNKTKTIEVRKRFPKDYKGWVYIYCTKDRKDYLYYDKDYGDYILLPQDFGELNGKVVARFRCDKVEEIVLDHNGYYAIKEDEQCLVHQECWIYKTCLTNVDLLNYLKSKNGYAIHISQLEIFDKPKELGEFYPYCKDKNGLYQCNKCPYGFSEVYYCECRYKPLTKAPQSFMYIEVEE